MVQEDMAIDRFDVRISLPMTWYSSLVIIASKELQLKNPQRNLFFAVSRSKDPN